ncbi:O-antigen ligase family protein [Ramlibacter sp. PS4R-6]|uniref:O-antigen ligase family protein n=1 Tax=Ramlibacter sp. PS4R-6 TaxID=3133438 RepID=UPI003095CB30
MQTVPGEIPLPSIKPAPWARKLAPALGVFLCAACLLVLTVRGWSPAVLFVGCLLCLAVLAWGHLPPVPVESSRAARLVCIVLVAPLVAVFVSSAFRADGYTGQLDAPLRFALAVPIFLFALRMRLDVAHSLRWMLPVALLLLLAARLVQGQPARWPAERMTTGFVDPLVFGYLSLTFGIMAMFGWPGEDRRSHPVIVGLAFVALALGASFSIGSQSRTGWLAVPLLAALWLHLHWSRARRWSLAWTAVGACVVVVAAFMFVPTIHARVLEALGEVMQYPWHSVPPDTPVSLRITYLRIAADVFAQHPWLGVGLTPLLSPDTLPPLGYASPVAVKAALQSGFHNQIVSDAVRHGIGGLFATVALLLVPLVVCLRALGSTSAVTRRNAAMGTAFFTCVFVASFTTEVVDLKYMASLYAVMAAIFCGAALARRDD